MFSDKKFLVALSTVDSHPNFIFGTKTMMDIYLSDITTTYIVYIRCPQRTPAIKKICMRTDGDGGSALKHHFGHIMRRGPHGIPVSRFV